MQHRDQSSIQQHDRRSGQCSSLNAASTSNATVTAAHCPEVLRYDEVGAVSSKHTLTHTHRHTGAGRTYHAQSSTQQIRWWEVMDLWLESRL